MPLDDKSGNWPDWNQLINGVAMVAMGEENYYAAEAFVGTVATAGASVLCAAKGMDRRHIFAGRGHSRAGKRRICHR